VRSQNMIASAEEGGRVTALLKEDISQMGTKSFGALNATSNSYVVDTVAKVHMAFNTDLSSYELVKSSNYDELKFRKAHYDENGKCLAVMEIQWNVVAEGNKGTLWRTCSIVPDVGSKCGTSVPGCDGKAVEIARDVKAFKLMPSKPGVFNSETKKTTDPLKFPDPEKTPGESFTLIQNSTSGGVVTPTLGGYKLYGFGKNVTGNIQNTSHFYIAQTGQSACKSFTFEPGEIYAIEFNLLCNGDACTITCSAMETACTGDGDKIYNEMVMFRPDLDHLSVGLRNPNNFSGEPIVIDEKAIPDFLFFPPQNNTAIKIRHFEFSVPQRTQACLCITAAFYSDIAYKGFLEVGNFKVYKTENTYYFPEDKQYNPAAPEKASAKAFRLELEIEKGGSEAKRGEINKVVTVIPVPNNGLVPAGGS